MRNWTRLATILTTTLLGGGLAAGCGSDGGSSAGDVTTGIAPNKLLSEVTEAEATAACENLADGVQAKLPRDELVRSLCTFFSAAFTETEAECETQRDACIQQANDESGSNALGDLEDFGPDCSGEAELSPCEGTVGQLEACINDTLDAFKGLLATYSCDDAGTIDSATADELMNEDTIFEPAASCDVLECGGSSPFGD